MLRGVSLASMPTRALNHCRSTSTSDTVATGTRKTRATMFVTRSNASSGGESRTS